MVIILLSVTEFIRWENYDNILGKPDPRSKSATRQYDPGRLGKSGWDEPGKHHFH
jgi:hypothetical protein